MITALVADDADDVGPTGKHTAVATASVDDDATIEWWRRGVVDGHTKQEPRADVNNADYSGHEFASCAFHRPRPALRPVCFWPIRSRLCGETEPLVADATTIERSLFARGLHDHPLRVVALNAGEGGRRDVSEPSLIRSARSPNLKTAS